MSPIVARMNPELPRTACATSRFDPELSMSRMVIACASGCGRVMRARTRAWSYRSTVSRVSRRVPPGGGRLPPFPGAACRRREPEPPPAPPLPLPRGPVVRPAGLARAHESRTFDRRSYHTIRACSRNCLHSSSTSFPSCCFLLKDRKKMLSLRKQIVNGVHGLRGRGDIIFLLSGERGSELHDILVGKRRERGKHLFPVRRLQGGRLDENAQRGSLVHIIPRWLRQRFWPLRSPHWRRLPRARQFHGTAQGPFSCAEDRAEAARPPRWHV